MTSSVILFAYFTHFSNINITRTNADIYKRCFYPFMEFYVIHLRNQVVKIWSEYHFKNCVLKRANDSTTISDWLGLLSSCVRNLKPLGMNGNRSQTRQIHSRDITNLTWSVFDLRILVFSRLIYGPHASQKTRLRTSNSVSKGCIIHWKNSCKKKFCNGVQQPYHLDWSLCPTPEFSCTD